MSAIDFVPSPGHGEGAEMMSRTLLCLVSLIPILLSGTVAAAANPKAAKPRTRGMVLFDKQIKPVLVKHCYKCHSKQGKKVEGGLELDSPEGLLRGGDSGAILVPHQVAKSPLIAMLRHDEDVSAMPPKQKLSDKEIAAFEEWIRLGAPDSRQDGGMTTKEERLQAGHRHWSFLPPKAVTPPPVKLRAWPRDEIDNFILARMEAQGVRPVADANRRTLVRRVYFDLIGLPPTPKEVDEFVADKSSDTLPRLIDRLLDSAQFGERWGRHWLDVVRYAESSGMEFNFTYPHAWPYRDYVIDSLNHDKPYDVFIREQIAGDLLPTRKGDSPATIEARHIAPSILAFGPKRHNSGGMEFRMDVVDDQINTVFRATLAMTVSCARCHDHKFDPIPTRDYYALAGIFLSTEPLYGTIKQKYSNNPTKLLPIGPNAAALHTANQTYKKNLQSAEKQLLAKRKELKTAADNKNRANRFRAEVAKRVRKATSPELAKAAANLKSAGERLAAINSEVAALTKRVADLKEHRPQRPQYAMSVQDRRKPADTRIAVRGNFRSLGDVVPRGFLSAVHIADAPSIDPKSSGRLQLARWITSPSNPLTARVMVNRIWHHLFGRGLVASVDNFGMIGKKPSHPQLLDALALRFIRNGWSVKRMIRAIMLSRTYQLSSFLDAGNMQIDPRNRLFWRATPRRLEAEAIRDAILAVSGQLDLSRPTGSTVTLLGDQLVRGIPIARIQPPSNHRSVYLPIVRDYLPELFDLFDFPSPSLVSGRRAVTNVPAQALYLRNSVFVAKQAEFAAKRLLASRNANTDAERADLAMRWAFGRCATDAERAGALRLMQLVRKTTPASKNRDVAAWAAWFHTLFTTAEFRFLVDIKSDPNGRHASRRLTTSH